MSSLFYRKNSVKNSIFFTIFYFLLQFIKDLLFLFDITVPTNMPGKLCTPVRAFVLHNRMVSEGGGVLCVKNTPTATARAIKPATRGGEGGRALDADWSDPRV